MPTRLKSTLVSRPHRRQRRRPCHTLLDSLESRLLLAASPQLWFYVEANLAVSSEVTRTEALIARAATVGYTYMMLADTKLGYDGILRPDAQNPDFDPTWSYYANTAAVLNYAAARGITVVPTTLEVGRADWIATNIDENLIEGQSVIGANFTVSPDGKSLIFNPTNPNLLNPSFASGSTGWALDTGTPDTNRVSIDNTTGHTDTHSLKVSAGDGRGFGIQTLTLQPHEEYHVSFYLKESNFSGDELVKIYDPSQGIFLEAHEQDSALTYNTSLGGWQKMDYMFNSGSSTSAELRMGSWGSTSGTLWYDDVSFTQTDLVNVVRNASAPVKIYRPNGTILTEGVDVSPIRAPYQAAVTGMTYATWANPLTITIPNGSALHAGDLVKIDYSGVQTIYDGQYAVTLSDPAVQTYLQDNIVQIRKMYAAGTPLMLGGYDEIRDGNTEPGEIAAGLTAGQLLAQSFLASYNTVHAVDPTTPIYTWSDMFDPYHNATNNYYLWNGDITGSWLGVPSDVTIMNWNLGHLNESLKFFAARGNPQIISGDYGAADGYAEAQLEVSEAVGAANVKGMMFTVWDGDYSQLENYAAGAKAAWAQYITPPTVTSVYVNSTSWSSNFLSYLATSGQGSSTLGYKIPTGSNQLNALPWSNINKISIQFSENVTIPQAALSLTGLNLLTYAVSTPSYNSTTHTATWTLANPIAADTLNLSLPALGTNAVTDIAGNPLDGEWTDNSSTVSGNGVTGGTFNFHINILPGDMNHDGLVDAADFDIWFSHLETHTFNPAQGDLNADGLVDAADFDLWFSHLEQSLPSAPAAPALLLAPSSPTTSSPGIAIPAAAPSQLLITNNQLLLPAPQLPISSFTPSSFVHDSSFVIRHSSFLPVPPHWHFNPQSPTSRLRLLTQTDLTL